MTGQLCLKWNNHSEAFNKLLKQIFLEDGAGYSDATILCHGKFYPVHRFVLSTCSEYFEEIFQQCVRLNNKHPFIIVKDIQPEQMEALLNYMYKGEVNVPQEHLPELVKAAEAFKVKGLAVPDDDDDEPPSKKKRSASSSNPSPVPKKSKNKEHYEPSRIKTENKSFSSPLVSKIKSEPVDNEPVPEEIPVVENRNIDNNSDLSIDKEEDLYSCEAFTFDSGDQFQEQQESESQWKEEFESFEEGEGSQEDPSNRAAESDPLESISRNINENKDVTIPKNQDSMLFEPDDIDELSIKPIKEEESDIESYDMDGNPETKNLEASIEKIDYGQNRMMQREDSTDDRSPTRTRMGSKQKKVRNKTKTRHHLAGIQVESKRRINNSTRRKEDRTNQPSSNSPKPTQSVPQSVFETI